LSLIFQNRLYHFVSKVKKVRNKRIKDLLEI